MKHYNRVRKINKPSKVPLSNKDLKEKVSKKAAFKAKTEAKRSDFSSENAYRNYIYKYGSEKEKSNVFAHFTTAGYGCMAMLIMAIALIAGTALKGFIGYILSLFIIGWVFLHFPNLMQMWTNIEMHNPDMVKYRMDKLDKFF